MRPARRKLTLTFDNGPDQRVTPLVLDELEQRRLPAFFFPVGERLEDSGNRSLMDRAAGLGHRFGNHTYSHPRPFGSLSAKDAIWEVKRTDELLGPLCEPDRYFRPSAGGGVMRPGVLNRGVVDYLMETRHTLVLWNVICEDWCRTDGSWVDIALEQIMKQDWSLLVLHDIEQGGMDHLATFLDRVAELGVACVDEMPEGGAELPIVRGQLRQSVDYLI